ncbi:MAG: DUF6069 family protein [Candidatus Nanopelagicales bacterium]|jgi:hypothetical protein|nr:DUF6069 family protein [Candidatus Nanopelagicales bacterium]MDP4666736.1 DUF6069 family protein [Candidatus Nanopelagicales bacterium]MDP4895937.1 DUF6069 family protein [Candidatus Nanopelagicales bacterium]MDP5050355.1 DUF6069 family protein [Candidatus Nanopelagicales bacterium]
MAKQVRQITPPAIRIWLVGIGATSLASGANAGWLWLCTNIFNLTVSVPAGLQSTTYVEATLLRIALATAIAGLIATVIAVVLSKLLIGPRIWFLVSGLAVGLSSIYGALTLPDISVASKFSLSVMHILATFLIVLPIAEALKIRESDLHRADLKYHEHFDNKDSTDAGVITTSTAVTQPANDDAENINQTKVIPLDSADGGTSSSE